jgi:type IV pilus assembly protein PilF
MRKKIYYAIVTLALAALTSCTSMSREPAEDSKDVSAAKINIQLGMQYLQMHDVERAKQKLLLALQEAPALPEGWYSMAYFQEATGNKILANKFYLKAVNFAPKRGDTQNNYGTFLCRAGHYASAVHRFELAVSDPNYLEMAAAYENGGLCALKIPNQVLAAQFFTKALQQDLNRPISLLELAQLNYQMGQYTAAKSHLADFFVIAPANPQALLLGAQLAKKMGDRKKAQQYLDKLHQNFPHAAENKQAISLYNLATNVDMTRSHGWKLHSYWS